VKQREISEADSDAFLSLAGYSMEKESRSEFLILSNGNWDLGESASDTRMESSVEIEIS